MNAKEVIPTSCGLQLYFQMVHWEPSSNYSHAEPDKSGEHTFLRRVEGEGAQIFIFLPLRQSTHFFQIIPNEMATFLVALDDRF